MVKIIIAGSRNFDNYDLLEKMCHQIFYMLGKEGKLTGKITTDISNMEIISGTANGADSLGEKFAQNYGITIKRFPARWDVYGKKAGYLRNVQMAEYAKTNGVLIAFWDTKSKGTKHMIDIAIERQIRTFIVDTNESKIIHDY